jgi:lipid-binding SYLF domain-containing protein
MMGRKSYLALLVLVALTVLAAPQLFAQRKEVRKVEDAIEVFQAIANIPEKQVPDYLMKNAYGVAIIPGVQKAGLVIGGQYGKGILLVRNEDRSWGYPVFITLTGGSIGWQIGVQSLDLVLFFRTKRSVDKILQESFTLGVDVGVAAGPLGRQAGAATDTELKALRWPERAWQSMTTRIPPIMERPTLASRISCGERDWFSLHRRSSSGGCSANTRGQ